MAAARPWSARWRWRVASRPWSRRRGLASLADALGIEVDEVHRALPDALTCARVFCALFPKLCATAPRWATRWSCSPLAGARARAPARRRRSAAGLPRTGPDLSKLPDDPGVYIFRDERGRPLYVGKSVSLRSRARSHFCAPAGWTEKAEIVDYRPTNSELGALVLENRLIKQWQPQGNRKLKRTDGYVYLRCRLEPPYPVLEVEPRARARTGGQRRPTAGPQGRRRAGRPAHLAVPAAPLRQVHAPSRSPFGSTGRWAAACPPAWATWTRTPTAGRWTRRWRCSAAPSPTPPLESWARCTSRWARRHGSSATSAPRRCAAAPSAWRACWAGWTGCCALFTPRPSWCWPATPPRSGSTRSGWWTAGWPTGGRCPGPASWPSAPRRRCVVAGRAVPQPSRSKRWTRCGSSPPGWPTTTCRRLSLAEEPDAAELAAFAA